MHINSPLTRRVGRGVCLLSYDMKCSVKAQHNFTKRSQQSISSHHWLPLLIYFLSWLWLICFDDIQPQRCELWRRHSILHSVRLDIWLLSFSVETMQWMCFANMQIFSCSCHLSCAKHVCVCVCVWVREWAHTLFSLCHYVIWIPPPPLLPHHRQRTWDTRRGSEAQRQRVAHGEGGAKRQEPAALCG